VRAKFINEKFTQDSDPIADMNIGMMHEIKLWMKSIGKLFQDKDNALIYSAKDGKLDFVEYLLAAGANLHVKNDGALQWASEKGYIKIVKVLLAAGADVHAKDDYSLRWASGNGHTEVVKILLAAGADVHANNDHALQWASYNGHIETVKVLLTAGADVHVDNDGALQWASINRHTEVVKVLKDHIAKEKKVKESLNEKFTEDDSDPIHDMGIGFINFIKRARVEDGLLMPYEASMKYFNSPDYTSEAFFIFEFLLQLLFEYPKYNKYEELNFNDIFNKKLVDYSMNSRHPNYLNLLLIKNALEKFYDISIDL